MAFSNGENLSDLERTGLLFLSRAKDLVDEGHYLVRMPFVQLKIINTALSKQLLKPLFPNDLLFFPSSNRPWKWDDFELMLPHFHNTLCRALLQPLGPRVGGQFKLTQLLRGCRGSPALLDIEVELKESSVFHEQSQYGPSFFLCKRFCDRFS